MNWFLNRKTITKLMIGFSILAMITGFVGYQGISGISRINLMLNSLYVNDLTGLAAVKEVYVQLMTIGRESRQIILDVDAASMQQDQERINQAFVKLEESMTVAEKTFVTEEGKRKIAMMRESLVAYRAALGEVVRLALASDNKGATAELARTRTVAGQIIAGADDAVQMKEARAREAYEESDDEYARARNLLVAVSIGAVLLALLMGYLLARAVSRPLVESVHVLESVANGDLTTQLNVSTKDEVGQMATALNHAIGSMRSALTQVSESANSVSAAAQQLASASEELSSGTQEQASSQEETSATLEELTSTVRQNAESARQANQLAGGARDSATKGGEVVASAVGAMSEINASSKRIADIITTIDEIAFQTNLLALNAAVEAARAGEQGRGFAVVAAEVRNLAQRSATAAKEIKGLIQDSVRKVENGSELVTKSGLTLDEIISSVKRVTDIISEIDAASQEQATGIEQVGKAMTQMDQVTQQNSAQTEELSSTAQAMASHAEQLQTLVAKFVLDGGDHVRRASSPPKEPSRVPVPASHALATRSLANLSAKTRAQKSRHEAVVTDGFESY